MADRLTQLQDCLDDVCIRTASILFRNQLTTIQLLTQMYASLNYVYQRHPYGDIPGQPSRAPQPAIIDYGNSASRTSANNDGELNARAASPTVGIDRNGSRDDGTPPPDPPETFHAALRELAQDLILKEQQIEHLINSLPGIGNSEADQVQRMRELEAELRQVEVERSRKETERLALIDLLGEVIGKVKRVP